MNEINKANKQEELLKQQVANQAAMLVPPPDRKTLTKREAEGQGKPRRKPFLVAFITSRRLHTLIFFAVLIYLIIWIPHFFWERTPDIPLKMLIVDKTVPFQDYREHKGLFWLLDNNKIVDPVIQDSEEKFYALDADYTGFYPPPEESVNRPGAMYRPEPTMDPTYVGPVFTSGETPNLDWEYDYITAEDLADRDMLYICDSYGVYSADYWQFTEQITHTIYSPKIYGGFEPEELTAIEDFVNQGGRTIVAEFNTLASPNDEALRDRLENIFGVDWTHWIGRYFVDFGDVTDVPWWLFELHEIKYGREWDLTGSGYLFCKDGEDDFFVLSDAEDMDKGGMRFVPRQDYMDFDVMQGSKDSTFTYWFDVVTVRPDADTQILADFEFKLTQSGRTKMAEHGLPLVIPAVIRRQTHYNAYYLCGEMTEFGKQMGPSDTKLTLHINRSFYAREAQGSTGFPFWQSSFPIVTNILRSEADLKQPLKVPVYPFK